jgi:protein TonB
LFIYTAAHGADVKARKTLVASECCLLVFVGGLTAHTNLSQEPQKPAAPLQEKAPTTVPSRIRVGGRVISSKLVHQVKPGYPKEAKEDHISGQVRTEALVGADGRVIEVRLISGDPILAKAAIEAIQKWRYRPTLLNGRPVEVLTEIDVNFGL